jgi:biopolymer transport protein ExbB
MAIVSWWVMWTKYLNWSSTKRANDRFLALYKHHPSIVDLEQTLLKDGDRKAVEKAPTYRIFRTGVGELHKRGNLKGRALTEETVESIRSALDSQQIKENQKLDANMVLLTICIAGGPFIGLFGTVLGVVITFAAVGMAGEVNVNAIAPGISASLVATLAGLFVAIPALFGYNILSTLNSGEADKARGFADEFVTGLAEAQRDAAMAA